MPAVFTVPLGQPFLSSLAEAILDGHLPRIGGAKPSPFDLSHITLLLPTPRAARTLSDAFLAASGKSAILLPRIRPISEGQEDLALLGAGAAGSAVALEIPPAIGDIERRLALTELVLAWSRALRSRSVSDIAPVAAAGASTPAQAAKLAAELAQLMDTVETEGASLAGLEGLVPEEFSAHWGQTLDFLKIVIEAWPAYLAETGKLSGAMRRNRVILAEAERLAQTPPVGPLIVAGVTGSIPATVALMRAVSALPQGAVVLPALDQTLDAASADMIPRSQPEHPQFGLLKLLATLGVPLADVEPLPVRTQRTSLSARRQLVSEAMRPSPTLEHWQSFVADARASKLEAACNGLCLIEAATVDEEAETLSLILRRAVDTPGITAALVSPDRLLARRVVNRLATMGIAVDDSAGRPLAKTPPGAFLNLVVDAWSGDFNPVALMALLKHPLTRLGREVPEIRRAARALELIAFRTPYLGRGIDGVLSALDAAESDLAEERRRQRAFRRLRDEDRAAARDLVAALAAAFSPLLALAGTGVSEHSLKDWMKAHAKVAESLAMRPASEDDAVAAGTTPLWQGEAGEEAQLFFEQVLQDAVRTPSISALDYPDLYRGLTATINVRPRLPAHPRISIWGPFEARLQQPDVIILGGLNDGTWPASADPGAWLNRPMRQELGLPAPEEAIGHAAHDFVSLLGADRVYLSRATKVDGVPTVPSRWLMRLTALLDGAGKSSKLTARKLLAARDPWQGWARARDEAGTVKRIAPPAPTPPFEWRPRRLPVTAIERWIANPYAIYAQHILKLEKIDPLGMEPGAALRGQIVHDALHRFAQRYPTDLPGDIAHALLEQARAAMKAYVAHPRVAAFWLPRFERFAHWFAETEKQRRSGAGRTIAEVEGSMVLEGLALPFTLRARADRMDIGDKSIVITDYKTGIAPANGRVKDGLAPQLPLEAAMALAGGFTGLVGKSIAGLAYVRVSGGEPPGEYRMIDIDDPEALAAKIRVDLERLIKRFDDPNTPYVAVRRAAFADSYTYDDYAHLARVAEWSGGDTGGEESAA